MTQYIEGIEYTEIPVSDLEQALDWYCNKLGAKVGEIIDEGNPFGKMFDVHQPVRSNT